MSLPCLVPSLQPVCAQGDVNPRQPNTTVATEDDVHWRENQQVNSIRSQACVLLAAPDSCAAHRADSLDSDGMDLDESDPSSTLQRAVDEKYDPERLSPRAMLRMPPPKRFYRTFWRSVARRLVRQWVNEARPARPSCTISISRPDWDVA